MSHLSAILNIYLPLYYIVTVTFELHKIPNVMFLAIIKKRLPFARVPFTEQMRRRLLLQYNDLIFA